MGITYTNRISIEDYNRLRAAVGFRRIPSHQGLAGLRNSAYLTAAADGEKTVGMARVLWDGGYTAFLADVMVDPDYQGSHIGYRLVRNILEFLQSQMEPGDSILISLGAAKQKEAFYQKLGFQIRPDESHGAGMSQWLAK